jgi:cephalosporin-C deacetylase-like acetyl esterase
MNANKRKFGTLLFVILTGPLMAQRTDEWNFLASDSMFQDPHGMLSSYLDSKAETLLAERRHRIEGITTRDDLKKRQQYWRERMWADLGGQPERTPLNARTVGVLDRGDYRIEKIIFESRPRLYVTANLYLPARGNSPHPAILYPLGHELGAKAHSAWQYTLANLARRGFVCLTWDPIGQGERVQFYDEDWQDSKLQASTSEHNVMGMQSLLVGLHMAQYTIWDGIRALDYLLSRPEVDPKRVGCTGNSGGGTHTAYISGLDDRIQVAAPSCYITSWHRMLQSIGPQDAEQVFPFWLKDGLDYPDFIYARDGKPFLILSAIRDFFPIGGARATYDEVRQTYAKLDLSDRIAMFEADDGHGYTKPRREAAYKWFTRQLEGAEDDSPESPVQLATEEELQCTPTGQVKTAFPDGADVYKINRAKAEQLRAERRPSPDEVRKQAAALTYFEPQRGPVHVTSFGKTARAGLTIEKFTYESEPGISIPSLLFIPEGGGRKGAILIADSRGKSTRARDAETLAAEGNVVLDVDLRGFGETRPASNETGSYARYFGDYRNAMMALLVGKTMTGMRALDVVRGLDVLAGRSDVDAARMTVIGRGSAAIPALYAALFDRRVSSVVAEGMLNSYDTVVSDRIAIGVTEQIVPSVLKHFDLPDVVAAIAPRQVILSGNVNAVGREMTPVSVRKEYTRATAAYQSAGVSNAFRIVSRNDEEESLPQALRKWQR